MWVIRVWMNVGSGWPQQRSHTERGNAQNLYLGNARPAVAG